jgi:hypothetical protein
MATATIQQVINHTDREFKLYSNDYYHPAVLNGKAYPRDQAMVISPGKSYQAQIAIPWVTQPPWAQLPYGRFGVVGRGAVECFVGPTLADMNNDYLRWRDADERILGEVKLGAKGLTGPWSNWQLIFDQQYPGMVGLAYMDGNGGVDWPAIAALLEEIAKVVGAIVGVGTALLAEATPALPVAPAWSPRGTLRQLTVTAQSNGVDTPASTDLATIRDAVNQSNILSAKALALLDSSQSRS